MNRLYDDYEPDAIDQELQQAQLERATFEDRLDAHASSGLENVRRLRPRADGDPLNKGAAREVLAGRDLGSARELTGVGEAMTDVPRPERDDILGASTESLMEGPTTLGTGGGSGRSRRDRTPNSLERQESQERRMRTLEQQRSTDAEKAAKAIEEHAPASTGRPLKGETPRIRPGRIDSGLIVALADAGAGANVEDQLLMLKQLIDSDKRYSEIRAMREPAVVDGIAS